MSKISAKVIADSRNDFGNRITTMIVTFPRIILAEFNTHRMFSRNSASSRAIPFNKMVKSIEENPFIPIAWQKEHTGMQGTEYITDEEAINNLRNQWINASLGTAKRASDLHKGAYKIEVAKDEKGNTMRGLELVEIPDTSVTKQLCNRLLEPFMWHTVIVTATEWENFFALRCPQYVPSERWKMKPSYRSRKDFIKDGLIAGIDQDHFNRSSELDWLQINKGQAEIHMMALAEAMWDAYNESTPKELKAGEWHIPFGDRVPASNTDETWSIEKLIKIATARCARVSYTVVGEEGKPDNYENDIKLHDRLLSSGHWSPFEHCARAMSQEEFHLYRNGKLDMDILVDKGLSAGWCGNFRGFIQYRKMFANENVILGV